MIIRDPLHWITAGCAIESPLWTLVCAPRHISASGADGEDKRIWVSQQGQDAELREGK